MESDVSRVLGVLDKYGIEYKMETDGRAKICCPFHDEKTPSMTIYDNNSCYCFGCQKYCWHDELVAKIANCSLIEAKKLLGTYDPNIDYSCSDRPKGKVQITNVDFADPVRDFSEQFKKLPQEVPPQMQKFLEGKGLQDYAFDLGKWRWHPRGTFKCWQKHEGICIPYFGPDGEVSTFRLRCYDRRREKFTHPMAPRGVPLQASYMIHDKTKPVYFCEGETDSLSMYALGRNVICLPGVGAHKQLHSAIMQCLKWQIPKLIFCGDNDDAGRTFNQYATEIAILLGLNIFCPQLRTLHLPEEFNMLPEGGYKRKDINDFLCEGRLEQILTEFENTDTRSGNARKTDRRYEPIPEPAPVQSLAGIFGKYEELTTIEGGLF